MAGVYPRRFGKYVLLKPMARGGMGEIYLAAVGDAGFQKFCVIKKIIAERSDRAKANRFLDEAKVVLRLTHANLVPTFDAGEIDGEFYIAMDLIEGKDLREIWNRCVRTRTRIPLDVALHVGREVARALSYVHGYGDLNLVHRDVAPPNILLSYFGEVKLTDFGLARSVLKKEQTAPGVVFGRASYLAPEQARGEVADARTDVYSLGIVLWELLTGNQYLQLANLDPTTAMSLVRHPRPQTPSAKAPWITPALDKLLMRALAPAREDRYQSAEELRQALADVMAEVAPRADTERVASFVKSLYEDAIREERMEREKLVVASRALPALAPAPVEAPPRDVVELEMPAVPAGPGPGISLAALDRAKVPVGPRPAAGPVVPGLAFPREEESLGVDFAGRVIDSRYRVLRKIGEGGMGTVYAAEHVEIGKIVAIKILHPHYSTEQELVERFRREARAASRIGHPNIIDVMDFGTTDDGCAYFIMEHLDGIDLADVLSHERRLDANRSCEITIQVCRGAGGRARGRRDPPRSQAGEHLPGGARRPGGLRQGAGLRCRAQRRPHEPADEPGYRDGHARIHGARAGGGRRRRSPQRHLFGRRAAVRDGHRPAAAEARRRAHRAARAAPAALGGPRSHRRARARPRSSAALSVDGAAGIRPRQDAVGTDAGRRRPARVAPEGTAGRTVAARHRRTTEHADTAPGGVPGARADGAAGRAPAGDAGVESGVARADAGDAAPRAVGGDHPAAGGDDAAAAAAAGGAATAGDGAAADPADPVGVAAVADAARNGGDIGGARPRRAS